MTYLAAAQRIVSAIVTDPARVSKAGLVPPFMAQDTPPHGIAPAHLFAAVFRRTGDEYLPPLAADVLLRFAGRWVRPDGAAVLASASGFPDETYSEITAVEAMSVFGRALRELRGALPAQTEARLIHAVRSMGDWLLGEGRMPFYVNGNIELVKCEALWWAYEVTGEHRFYSAYERQAAFARSPDRGRTTGWVSSSPTDGYFAEYGAGAGNLDWHYTHYQCDVLSDLVWATGDPRWSWYLARCVETLRPRIDKTVAPGGWVYAVDGGSRVGVNQQPGAAWRYFWTTPALHFLGDAEADSAVTHLTGELSDVSKAQAPGYWRTWSRSLAVLVDIEGGV